MSDYLTAATPIVVAPAAADPVTLSWGGGSWVNGAWQELVASTGGAALVVALSIEIPNTNPFTRSWEVDLGAGAAGAEAVLATIKGHSSVTGSQSFGWLRLPVPLALAASMRLAARLRIDPADFAFKLKVAYIVDPPASMTVRTSQAMKVTPTSAAPLDLTPNAVAWANSAWVEVTPATATAWTLVGACVQPPGDGEIDLGIGAAGAETVVATLKFSNQQNEHGPGTFLTIPNTAIGAGQRVAIRMRTSYNGALTSVAWVYYFEGAL